MTRKNGLFDHIDLIIYSVFALLSVLLVWSSLNRAKIQSMSELDNLAFDFANSISLQFGIAETEISLVSSSIESRGLPTPAEFNSMIARTARLHQRRNLRAIGIAGLIRNENVESTIAYLNSKSDDYISAGYPAIPQGFFPEPTFTISEKAAIVLVEPEDMRQGAFGLDLFNSEEIYNGIRATNRSNEFYTYYQTSSLVEDAAQGLERNSFILHLPAKLPETSDLPWTDVIVAAPLTPELFFTQYDNSHLNSDVTISMELADRDDEPTLINIAGNGMGESLLFEREQQSRPVSISLTGLPIDVVVSRAHGTSLSTLLQILLTTTLLASFAILLTKHLKQRAREQSIVEHELGLRLSDLQQSERKLAQLQKNEAMGQLVEGIAHDFNNILFIAMGNAEIIADKCSNTKCQYAAKQIFKAAESGSALSSQLLSYGRRALLVSKRENVKEILEEAGALFRRVLPANVDIDIDTCPATSQIKIDRGQLESALINLVINASHALTDKGIIRIRAENFVVGDPDSVATQSALDTGNYVRITVMDNGHGMSEETMGKMFDPYFSTKPSDEGSGLGLSMLQGFVEQSGGAVGVESKPGEGTSIFLYLPAASHDDDAQRSSNNVATAGNSVPDVTYNEDNRVILLVEDNPIVQQTLCAMLEEDGVRIICADNGDEALKKLEANDVPDILISDLIMPGTIQCSVLIKYVRDKYPGMPVIVMSGHPLDRITDGENVFDSVVLLKKPVSRKDLDEAIHNATELAVH